MSRLLALLVGLLALSLSASASFLPSFGADDNTVVLAIYADSDPYSSQLVVPPMTISSPTCQPAPISYVAVIPELAYFTVNPLSSSSYQLSFGCPTSGCSNCAVTLNNVTADVRDPFTLSFEAPSLLIDLQSDELVAFGNYWVMIYSVKATTKTLTTYLYTDPTCSSFVWPSTPLVTSSGDCTKSDYFTGLTGCAHTAHTTSLTHTRSDATYFSVLQLSGAYYSIAASCDKKCQNCAYGGIGLLLPTQGANNCSNIVLSPLSPTNYTCVILWASVMCRGLTLGGQFLRGGEARRREGVEPGPHCHRCHRRGRRWRVDSGQHCDCDPLHAGGRLQSHQLRPLTSRPGRIV